VSPGGSSASGSPYVTTSKMGRSDGKTFYSRLTPQLRRKTDGTGTPTSSLSIPMYRERHDTTAQRTGTGTLDANRYRFDFTLADNFAQFKLTFRDMDVEIDDVLVTGGQAGV
jgi:hypothetical protein